MNVIERLKQDATQCRYLAQSALTDEGRSTLLEMAQDYERRAAAVGRRDAIARSAMRWSWAH